MKNFLIIISTAIVLIAFGCKKEGFNADSPYFYPNSFTPNGDGMNDKWWPIANWSEINLSSYSMKIFTKKDKLLFETSDWKIGWDGKAKGENCPEDYYYYVVKFESIDEVKYKDVGMFQLIR
ncbi:MAG: hypothetical protein BWY70_00097 [Bacteroidetes bacterium ADurb.Bin408]|nr:MAG: hypothetical protein BWY70_00097 [Bacteroidetes bacterium ADurb.Bin408]